MLSPRKLDLVERPKREEAVSPAQALAYMGDMLENMRKIARAQGLDVLAHMLELTRMEARLAARDFGGQQTVQPIRHSGG